VPGDSQDQGSISSADARINLPNSYRRNDGRVELGYEVWNRTEISAGYQHLVTDRSWTEADEVKEDVFKAGIHGRPITRVDFRVDANWSNRDGGDYFSEAPLVWGFSPEHVATLNLATDFENNPLLRKFNFADRERQGVDARVAYMPIDTLTLSGQV